MNKILYLLLMLVMLWVGGIYRIDGLLALGIAELLLWICLALISWRRRKHLKLGFEKQLATAPRQKRVLCTLRAENTGKGAIPRFRARLQYCYPWESKNKKLYVFGSLRGGEVQLSRVELPVKYCGLLLLELDKIRVYDWFGLTSSSSRKQSAQGTLAVLPPVRAMRVELSYRSAGDSTALLLRSLPQQIGDSEEIRQLREYQEGDNTRNIHWKQSARTEKLWVKEFEQEADRLVELHLVWEQFRFSTSSQREGFYVILSAILHGLLQVLPQVPVYWTDLEGRIQGLELTGEDGVTPLLLRLYHLELGERLPLDHPAPPMAPEGKILQVEFTTGLQLRENHQVLYTFSPKQYQQQLSQFTLKL